jgi:hypothetical protein
MNSLFGTSIEIRSVVQPSTSAFEIRTRVSDRSGLWMRSSTVISTGMSPYGMLPH